MFYGRILRMKVEITAIPPKFDRYTTQAEILEACSDTPLAGYPPPQDRWHIPADEWDAMVARDGFLTVPPGPWHVRNHPTRAREKAQGILLDPEDPNELDDTQKAAWRSKYDLVTDQGLPVHPMAKLGVTSEVWDERMGVLRKLGMATGIGRERRFGALNTSALLLARTGMNGAVEYAVVKESRNKKERRSFPGGYAELGEDIAAAAVRESGEEAGVVEACEAAGIPWNAVESLPHVLWKLSPSVNGPCTLVTWLVEHFRAIDATNIPDMQGVALKRGESTIRAAEWVAGRELLAAGSTLLGAHRRALRAHLDLLQAA